MDSGTLNARVIFYAKSRAILKGFTWGAIVVLISGVFETFPGGPLSGWVLAVDAAVACLGLLWTIIDDSGVGRQNR